MGHIQKALSPLDPVAICLFQQLFKCLTYVQRLIASGGLVSAKRLQPIQQTILINGQGLTPGRKAPIQQQSQKQVLDVHRAMAPAAGLVLAGDQQIPGGVTETLRIGGETGRGRT